MQINLISIHLTGDTSLDSFEIQLLSWGSQFFGTVADAGSMYGHACARTAISVAAIPHVSVLKSMGEIRLGRRGSPSYADGVSGVHEFVPSCHASFCRHNTSMRGVVLVLGLLLRSIDNMFRARLDALKSFLRKSLCIVDG